jgi:hypothetical protein
LTKYYKNPITAQGLSTLGISIHELKKMVMKKNVFIAIAGIMIFSITSSCSKSDPAPQSNVTVEGKWVGLTTAPVGPSRYLALTFNAGGNLLVDANNPTTPDMATGTWAISGDSVRASFTYTTPASGTFSLAGKFVVNATTMNGTIGTGTSTSGVSTFTTTKQ